MYYVGLFVSGVFVAELLGLLMGVQSSLNGLVGSLVASLLMTVTIMLYEWKGNNV